MASEEQRNQDIKKIMDIFLNKIDNVFLNYRKKVDQLNVQNGRSNNKNQKQSKIYSELTVLSKQLKIIEKQVHQCDKLRKERRELFQKKTSTFIDAINDISKNNIKIKINRHLQNLINSSKQTIENTKKCINLYKNQSMAFCGKSYDYKTAVQKCFLQLSQHSFLWKNIPHFQSITDESVKQIAIPIQYKIQDFKKLQADLIRLYPQPKENVKTVYVDKIVQKNIPNNNIQIQDMLLAHQLLFGFTRPQQIQRAIEIYQKYSKKQYNNPTAINAIASLHQQGKWLPKDPIKALSLYKRSADIKNAQGIYKVGKYLEMGGFDYKQILNLSLTNRQAQILAGIKKYQQAAKQNHLDALADLGYIFQKGIADQNGQYVIQPNQKNSFSYYEKAKQKNFPRALNNLGNLLISKNNQGNMLSQNAAITKGIKYLQKAIQFYYKKAYISLGKCYLNGIGVPMNIDKARSLFKQASIKGQSQGSLQLLKSYIGTNLDDQGTMLELADTARSVLIQDKNHPQALYFMGLLSEKGIGMLQNKQASFHYISLAAKQYFPPALTRLGDYYYSGYYVKQNFQNARIMYEKAGERNQSQALLNLGLMEQKGLLPEGTTLGQGQNLVKMAEDMGNTNALLIKGLDKYTNVNRNIQVIQAAQKGNHHALKLLSSNQPHPLLSKIPISYNKKSNLYLKQGLPKNTANSSFYK